MKNALLVVFFLFGFSIPGQAQITGTLSLCAGAHAFLSDATTGGTWSSSNTAVATIIATAGYVSGVTTGTAIITYNLPGSVTTAVVTVNPLPSAGTLSGSAVVCANATDLLTDAVTGGTWSSSATGIATVDSTGHVHAVSAGTVVISYSASNSCGTATATRSVTVNGPPSPGTITGSSIVCIGASVTLADPITGGTWSCSAISIATIGSTGIIFGISAGTAIISYSVTNVCGMAFATKAITVNPLPVAGIVGVPATICPGATVTLTETVTGGSWGSSDPLIASVGAATGIITGIDSGRVVLNYTVTNGCGSAVTHDTVAVHPLPFAGSIAGSSIVCNGSSIALTDTTAGGLWSSSGPVASVAGGIVTGAMPGTDSIKYSVSNICGVATASKIITIEPLPPIHTVTGGGNYCSADSGVAIGLSGSETGIFYQLFMGIVPITGSVAGIGGSIDFGIYSIPGVYTILATNGATGCNNNMTGSDTITVTPTTTPTVAITASPGLHVGIGESDTLTATVTGGGATPAYQWYKNRVAILGATTNTYIDDTYFDGDSVLCVVISSEVCGTQAAAAVIITLAGTGVKQVNAVEQFVVYPNPNNGVFTANLFSITDEPVHIIVTNIVGEKVKEVTTLSNNATEIKLDYAGGVYFISALAASGHYVVKVVIND